MTINTLLGQKVELTCYASVHFPISILLMAGKFASNLAPQSLLTVGTSEKNSVSKHYSPFVLTKGNFGKKQG